MRLLAGRARGARSPRILLLHRTHALALLLLGASLGLSLSTPVPVPPCPPVAGSDGFPDANTVPAGSGAGANPTCPPTPSPPAAIGVLLLIDQSRSAPQLDQQLEHSVATIDLTLRDPATAGDIAFSLWTFDSVAHERLPLVVAPDAVAPIATPGLGDRNTALLSVSLGRLADAVLDGPMRELGERVLVVFTHLLVPECCYHAVTNRATCSVGYCVGREIARFHDSGWLVFVVWQDQHVSEPQFDQLGRLTSPADTKTWSGGVPRQPPGIPAAGVYLYDTIRFPGPGQLGLTNTTFTSLLDEMLRITAPTAPPTMAPSSMPTPLSQEPTASPTPWYKEPAPRESWSTRAAVAAVYGVGILITVVAFVVIPSLYCKKRSKRRQVVDEPSPLPSGATSESGNAATATKTEGGRRAKNPQPLKKLLFNIEGTSGGISVGATPPTSPPITPMDEGTVIASFFRQDRRLSADDLSPTIRGRRTSLQSMTDVGLPPRPSLMSNDSRRTSIGSVISAVTAFSAGAKPELLKPGRVSPVSRADLQLGRPIQPTRQRLSLKIHKLAVDVAARTGGPVTNDEDDGSHGDSLGDNDSDGVEAGDGLPQLRRRDSGVLVLAQPPRRPTSSSTGPTGLRASTVPRGFRFGS